MLVKGAQENSKATPFDFARLFSMGLCALIPLVALYYLTGGNVGYTIDSLIYRDAALNFIAGYPAQSTGSSSPLTPFTPLVVWPPAYPALWGLASSIFRLPIDTVPFFINSVLLLISSLSIFSIVSSQSQTHWPALLISVACTLSAPCLNLFSYAWSEALCIPLLLLAYRALIQIQHTQKYWRWILISALCIGLANWARYASAIFIPLLALSILLVSRASLWRRFVESALATAFTVCLVAPLWYRNFSLTGSLSGSFRGGAPRLQRWPDDLFTIVELLVYSVFNFSVLLHDHLLPLLLLAIFWGLVKYGRQGKFSYAPIQRYIIQYPALLWALGYLAFLLYARLTQERLDLDFRMLAIAIPFLLLSLTPCLVPYRFKALRHSLAFWITLALLSLILYTGMSEMLRINQLRPEHGVLASRATFGISYRNHHKSTPMSQKLIAALHTASPVPDIILTDYRAVYIQYLSSIKTYAPEALKDCSEFKTQRALLFIRAPELPLWVDVCLKTHPAWQLIPLNDERSQLFIR